MATAREYITEAKYRIETAEQDLTKVSYNANYTALGELDLASVAITRAMEKLLEEQAEQREKIADASLFVV